MEKEKNLPKGFIELTLKYDLEKVFVKASCIENIKKQKTTAGSIVYCFTTSCQDGLEKVFKASCIENIMKRKMTDGFIEFILEVEESKEEVINKIIETQED